MITILGMYNILYSDKLVQLSKGIFFFLNFLALRAKEMFILYAKGRLSNRG